MAFKYSLVHNSGIKDGTKKFGKGNFGINNGGHYFTDTVNEWLSGRFVRGT